MLIGLRRMALAGDVFSARRPWPQHWLFVRIPKLGFRFDIYGSSKPPILGMRILANSHVFVLRGPAEDAVQEAGSDVAVLERSLGP